MSIPTTQRGLGPLLALLLLAAPLASASPAPVWQPLAAEIAAELDRAQALYAVGDPRGAKRAVVKAYFGLFEDRKMEAAMRTELGARHAYGVEKRFGGLRKAIRNQAPPGEVKALVEALREGLRRDAIALDQAGIPATVFEVNR